MLHVSWLFGAPVQNAMANSSKFIVTPSPLPSPPLSSPFFTTIKSRICTYQCYETKLIKIAMVIDSSTSVRTLWLLILKVLGIIFPRKTFTFCSSIEALFR